MQRCGMIHLYFLDLFWFEILRQMLAMSPHLSLVAQLALPPPQPVPGMPSGAQPSPYSLPECPTSYFTMY